MNDKDKNKLNSRVTIFLAACAMLLSGAQARAQGAADSLALEEIVVTARRVEENLQDVPTAISAFSGAELQSRGALDLRDVGAMVPSVEIQGSSNLSGLSAAAVMFIRGIGQDDFTIVADPAVGTHLDGVYLGRTIGSLLELADVERIEVLRGPQGTLFGRNSIGGAISVVSRKPEAEFGSDLRVTLGQDEREELRAVVNVPLSDTVYSRFSYLHRDREGYVTATQYDDLFTGSDGLDAVRGQISVLPSDSLRLDLAADYTQKRETPAAQTLFLSGGPGPNWTGMGNPVRDHLAFNQNLGGLPELSSNPELCGSVTLREIVAGAFPPNDPACAGPYWISKGYENNSVWTDSAGNKIVPENEVEVLGLSATLTWDVGAGTLKTIVSTREMEAAFAQDNDMTPFTLVYIGVPEQSSDQDSVELQYTTGLADDRVSLTAGVYVFDETAYQFTQATRGRAAQREAVGTPLEMARVDGFHYTNQYSTIKNASDAIYLSVNWDVTDQWHLTLGARHTEETKDFTNTLEWPGNGETRITDAVLEASETSPMFSLGYDVSDNVFVYGTYSEGFRSGGFPARGATLRITPIPGFDPEFAETFEVGFKSDFWDGRARLNVAAYTNSYTDMQLSGTPLGIPLGASAGSSIENLGDSTINGLEVELTAQVTDNLRLDFAGARMDAGFDCLVIVDTSFNRVGCSPEQTVSAGDSTYTIDSPLPRTPDLSYNVGATYIVALPNGGALSGRVDYKYMDDYVFTAAPKPQELGAGYEFVNARLTYLPADDPWSITIGATNLTDQHYITGIIHGGLNTKVAVARPRHFYASFDYRFGSSAR